jgi:hypothetical protein
MKPFVPRFFLCLAMILLAGRAFGAARKVTISVFGENGQEILQRDREYRTLNQEAHVLGRESVIFLEKSQRIYVRILHWKLDSSGKWDLDTIDPDDNDYETSESVSIATRNAVHLSYPQYKMLALDVGLSECQREGIIRFTRKNQGWKDGNWSPDFERIVFVMGPTPGAVVTQSKLEKVTTAEMVPQVPPERKAVEAQSPAGKIDCSKPFARENLVLRSEELFRRNLTLTLSPNPQCLTVKPGQSVTFQVRRWREGPGEQLNFEVVPRSELQTEWIAAKGSFDPDKMDTYVAKDRDDHNLPEGMHDLMRLVLVVEKAPVSTDNRTVTFNLPPVLITSAGEATP